MRRIEPGISRFRSDGVWGCAVYPSIYFKMEEESNRHLHTRSIVTTLLLPPTLVRGIFGMNTKGLPLTDVETGFLWAAALMIGAAGLARRNVGSLTLLVNECPDPICVIAAIRNQHRFSLATPSGGRRRSRAPT